MNRIGKAAIGTLLLGVLTLTGCTKMVEGVVVGKEYDDADTWTTRYCASYKPSGGCAVYSFRTDYDGPHWYLELDGTNDEGERDRGRVEVGADEYSIFDVGAHYPGEPGQPVEYVDGGDDR